MKTSVSSLNVMIWIRDWETYSQKGKRWLCQNQNPTLTAIRSAKMTAREASVSEEFCHCVSYLGLRLSFAVKLQLRGAVGFAVSSFIIQGFFSPCVFGSNPITALVTKFLKLNFFGGALHLRKKIAISRFIIWGYFFLPMFSGEGQEPAFSFLATLASSSSEEMESQLQERVESSRRAVSQIVTVYDKLQEKVELLSRKLNSGGEERAWRLRSVGRRSIRSVRHSSGVWLKMDRVLPSGPAPKRG